EMYLKATDPYPLKGKLTIQPRGREFSYEQPGLETSLDALQRIFDLLSDLAHDYPIWVALGGETVPMLYKVALDKELALQPVAERILEDIALDTRYRLSQNLDRHFCVYCLTHCDSHKIKLQWWKTPLFYYGCRLCGQSRNIFTGSVVAVLDNETGIEQSRENRVLWVNWFVRRQIFDFSAVRIEQATDEEVERFVVQIGNDTDPKRRSRYAQINCQVSAECHLSQNSKHLLQRTFGRVTFERQATATNKSIEQRYASLDDSVLQRSSDEAVAEAIVNKSDVRMLER
ncbi:MAG: hypothetical protein AAF485_32220, partial [Chloroflexota bacterium]